jgi:flavin reductase (DIM6/NTAB) family NADH-FMN oxidoreductase RutF
MAYKPQTVETIMDRNKINLGRDVRINPMVIGLIGSQVNGKANFVTVGQVYKLNKSPAYIGTSIHPTHYTAGGIREHKAFSVNIPHCGMADVTDYCGIVSGKNHDKSTLFELFYGELGEVAPMIVECPMCFECKLVDTLEMPSNTLYVGEVVASYSEKQFVKDGHPDVQAMNPLLFTATDKKYWSIGSYVAKAYKVGIGYEEKD